jgi:hypothetical protein
MSGALTVISRLSCLILLARYGLRRLDQPMHPAVRVNLVTINHRHESVFSTSAKSKSYLLTSLQRRYGSRDTDAIIFADIGTGPWNCHIKDHSRLAADHDGINGRDLLFYRGISARTTKIFWSDGTSQIPVGDRSHGSPKKRGSPYSHER